MITDFGRRMIELNRMPKDELLEVVETKVGYSDDCRRWTRSQLIGFIDRCENYLYDEDGMNSPR